MKTLFDPVVVTQIQARLAALRPASERRWGRMTPHQAVCHLSDTLQMALGERPIDFRGSLLLRTVVRFIVLTLPAPWPKGVGAAPEIDQEHGGTPPAEFSADKEALRVLIGRFIARPTVAMKSAAPDFWFDPAG